MSYLTEESEFKLKNKQAGGGPRRKKSFARLYDPTKHSGATDAGLPFDKPTMRLPGPRRAGESPQKVHQGCRVTYSKSVRSHNLPYL